MFKEFFYYFQVTLNKTLNHCFVLRMGRKAVGPMCCVMHVKEPNALIEKRRGSPRCSLFDRVNIMPQHLLNDCMVLCTTKRSRSHNANVVPRTLQ